MDIQEAFYARRSVREYMSEPIARSTIEGLIEAAIQAPSAMNEQPWVFSVIEDQKLLDRISTAAKSYMLAAAPMEADASHVSQMLADPAFHIFYHAPALVVISAKGKGRWGIEDCALAAENLMLAACSIGLGSCWIGFAQAWLQTEEGHAALNISADDLPVAPIILGRPKSVASHAPRREADVRWVGA
jgi:nitroreductase